MAKRYYWLKLKEDFFSDKTIKKLRKLAGGDTYTIIYLKLMLLSLRDGGKLFFDGIEDTFEEEIALTIDEEIEDVKVTMMYLLKTGLMEEVNPNEINLTQLPELVGSETDKAELMRKSRARKKIVDGGNIVTEELPGVTKCYTDIDIDKETELEEEKEKEQKPQLGSVWEEEFNALWERYPRKDGKKDALRHYKTARKNGVLYDTISDGLNRYNDYIKSTKTQKQYIKKGSTWFCSAGWDDEYAVERKLTPLEEWAAL